MIKLLLVEDDESLAYIEKTGLEDIIGGYEVSTAKNGKEGVKAWEEIHPDVIISDIDMPVMNGFEMVERIRETDGDVIIIFTSALTSPNDVKAGYRLGINNYVKKPFVPEELDAHIQALMKSVVEPRLRTRPTIISLANIHWMPVMPHCGMMIQAILKPSLSEKRRYYNFLLKTRTMWFGGRLY